MKVIMFGATGYLGSAISHALIRNGHIVVGVTRNAEQARKLLAEEVIPAVGDPFAAETFSAHLADADVVIDVASGDMLHDGPRRFALIESLVVDPSIRAAPTTGVPKIAYFYTSGTWVHGDNRSVLRSDNAPLNPPMIVAWRPKLEQAVVNSSVVSGIVIRSSTVYGRAGGLWPMLFSQAGSGKVEWFGVPGGTYATVHVDDLAECYLLAVEKNHLVSGLVIDVTNERMESVDGFLYSFAHLMGLSHSDVSYRAPANPLEGAMSVTYVPLFLKAIPQ